MTFQGRDVDESRYMYDQLAVLAPIMLAMTAATPIFKGKYCTATHQTELSSIALQYDMLYVMLNYVKSILYVRPK